MKTPKQWNENLAKGVITEEMLDAVLYSLNKRAKNCRNQKRLYKNSFDKYHNSEKYEAQEEKYYDKKSFILNKIPPVCIHKEFIGFKRTRHYDYESDFRQLLIKAFSEGTIVWCNSYYDYDFDTVVSFIDIEDVNEPQYNYYLFYMVGEHSFHEPIDKKDITKYNNIPVFEIGRIVTNGHDISDLCSIQFCDKLIDTLKMNNYVLDINCMNPYIMDSLQEIVSDKEKPFDFDEYYDKNIEFALNNLGDTILSLIENHIKMNSKQVVVDFSGLTDEQTKELNRIQKEYDFSLRKDCKIVANQIQKEIRKMKNRIQKKPSKCNEKWFINQYKRLNNRMDTTPYFHGESEISINTLSDYFECDGENGIQYSPLPVENIDEFIQNLTQSEIFSQEDFNKIQYTYYQEHINEIRNIYFSNIREQLNMIQKEIPKE